MKKFKHIFLTIVLASVATMISGTQIFAAEQQEKSLVLYSLIKANGEAVSASESKYSVELIKGASEASEPRNSSDVLHFVGLANESSGFLVSYDQGKGGSGSYGLGEFIKQYYASEHYKNKESMTFPNASIELKNAPVDKCNVSLSFGLFPNELNSIVLVVEIEPKAKDSQKTDL